MALRVAVCTNRSGTALQACLEALSSQVPAADVVIVASGMTGATARALAEAVEARLPGAQVRAEPVSGLSRARNTALEGLQAPDVIAYVDDDAVLGEGWYRALCAAWDEAPDDVACIGGPVRVRFEPSRPRWVHDAMLDAYSGLDLGSRPLDLDPPERVVRGANMSFRVGALHAVGDFDEQLGHAWTKDWYGDEDAAELALNQAGWRVRYDPALWIWHVIESERLSRRALLERRFWYGAGVGDRGLRARPLAVRWTLRGLAGAAGAAFRRDPGWLMVSAVFTAENTGVLLGPLVARRRDAHRRRAS